MNISQLNLANIFGISGGQWIPIVIPATIFIVGGTVAITAMYFHNRRKALWHETARLAIEKGQPLPPTELDEVRRYETVKPNRQWAANDDIRAGLISIATGAGLFLFFQEFLFPLRYVAAIPGFVGVALLLHGLLTLAFSRKDSSSGDRPPQS